MSYSNNSYSTKSSTKLYSAKSSVKSYFKFKRYDGWLPANPEVYDSFIAEHVKLAHKERSLHRAFAPESPVDKFRRAIEDDPLLKDLVGQIFLQVSDKNSIDDFETLLYFLEAIIQSAPPYYVIPGTNVGGPIGVPIYLILDLFSNTSAGFDLFRLPQFNVAIKDLLDSWGNYLKDPNQNSNAVLNTSEIGWFGTVALESLERELGGLTFDETYNNPDPSAENRGYESWDAFFVRLFQDGRRPIHFAEDKTLIHSACESTVYRIAYNIKAHDQFWLKAQKYSLYDVLNRDEEMVNYFIGGTIYHAFLSPLDYHRWHSPIDGVIEKIVSIPGTYYAALPDEGAPFDDPDLPAGSPFGAIIRSQSFLTVVAARVLIYIQADNPDIGRVCFVGVGMVEVSTIEVTVTEGQTVKTGDEIGMFHFGGSTHVLIFGPNCNVAFAAEASVDNHVWVNSIIGQVVPRREDYQAASKQ